MNYVIVLMLIRPYVKLKVCCTRFSLLSLGILVRETPTPYLDTYAEV